METDKKKTKKKLPPGWFKNMGRLKDNPQDINRKGRPAYTNWSTRIKKLLPEDRMMEFKNALILDEDGNSTGEFANVLVRMSNQDTIILAAIRRARKGDIGAFRVLMDRTDGPPDQKIDIRTFFEGITIDDDE